MAVSRQKLVALRAHALEHKSNLERVVDRRAITPMRKDFDASMGQLHRSLERASKVRRAATPADMVQLNTLVRGQVTKMYKGMAASLSDTTADSLTEGVRSLAKFYARASGRGQSVLDDPRVSAQIVDRRRAQLERERKVQVADMAVTAAYEVKLKLAAAQDLSVREAAMHAAWLVDHQQWKLERTARTESSIAFNMANNDGIAALAQSAPGLYKRWTELVSDIDGSPLDKRVGVDSIVMHGQLARPDRSFHMPDDPRTPSHLAGKSWQHPPNRPNDRAVLLPWEPGWGTPGWVLKGGRRVSL